MGGNKGGGGMRGIPYTSLIIPRFENTLHLSIHHPMRKAVISNYCCAIIRTTMNKRPYEGPTVAGMPTCGLCGWI